MKPIRIVYRPKERVESYADLAAKVWAGKGYDPAETMLPKVRRLLAEMFPEETSVEKAARIRPKGAY